ncbi:uncharacterized protein [Linepithema humile]|uniref:uncharacterized protein n=1 Tax=Linepithema humile TaxID=83485 RepID=UPI0006234AAA|nr:PREDICTED: uncharacterized protein LOC105677800 [Linepithema humile]
MDNTKDVITSIYNTLVSLRYPHIANAESKDLETTVLNGENRLRLFSWILTEKLPSIVDHLEKLKDAALEDQLFNYYSQIGLCNNKDILLGKSSLKEQLPFLKLLLDFMKKVHMKSFVNKNETEETLMDIVKLYIDDDINQVSSLSVVKPKVSYLEAIKYFEENKKEILINDCEDTKTNLSEDLDIETDKLVNEECDDLLDKAEKKFIEAFETISSWPIPNRNLDKVTSDSICSNLKNICSDFSTLKKVLQARDEVSKVILPKKLSKTCTSLSPIIEDVVINHEELENLSMKNDSVFY